MTLEAKIRSKWLGEAIKMVSLEIAQKYNLCDDFHEILISTMICYHDKSE